MEGGTGGRPPRSHHHHALRLGHPKSATQVRCDGGPMRSSSKVGGCSIATMSAACSVHTACTTASDIAPDLMCPSHRLGAALGAAIVAQWQSGFEVAMGMDHLYEACQVRTSAIKWTDGGGGGEAEGLSATEAALTPTRCQASRKAPVCS